MDKPTRDDKLDAKVCELLTEAWGIPVTLDTEIGFPSIDSLDYMEGLMDLDKHFDIHIPDEVAYTVEGYGLPTVRDIADAVKRCLHERVK